MSQLRTKMNVIPLFPLSCFSDPNSQCHRGQCAQQFRWRWTHDCGHSLFSLHPHLHFPNLKFQPSNQFALYLVWQNHCHSCQTLVGDCTGIFCRTSTWIGSERCIVCAQFHRVCLLSRVFDRFLNRVEFMCVFVSFVRLMLIFLFC